MANGLEGGSKAFDVINLLYHNITLFYGNFYISIAHVIREMSISMSPSPAHPRWRLQTDQRPRTAGTLILPLNYMHVRINVLLKPISAGIVLLKS